MGRLTPRLPPRPLLAALLVLAVAPPFVARAAGTMVGSFAMFTRVERYHVSIEAFGPGGPELVPLRSLAPHFSRDARRMLLPAAGFALGGDQIELVDAALPDLATLVCALRPESTRVRVTRARGPLRGELTEKEVERACSNER